MRYVNPACAVEEQNLVACQSGSEIYFYTIKPLYPGQELLVWYCHEFAQRCNYPPLAQLAIDNTGMYVSGLWGIFKKVQGTEFSYPSSQLAFLSDASPARSLNQSVNQLTCSFVLLFKNYSVTPTALLWSEQHKGGDRSPESREGLSPAIAALFGKDDTNFETLDSISVSLFPLPTESRLVSLWHTKQPASIHKHKGRTCQRRNRMHAPKHSFTRTRAHTRGRLRCWQHSGTTPLFIWLLRRKRVRKHSSVTTWTSWQDDPLTDWYLTECWLFVC